MYAPPGAPVQSFEPTPDATRSRLMVPGIALAVLSGILIAVFLLDLVIFASGSTMGTMKGLPPETQSMMQPLMIGVCIFGLLANAFNVFAAVQMLRVRMWGVAFAGCIISAIPITSSACCLLTLPFSIWAIVVLLKPEVRAAFKRVPQAPGY